MKKVFLLLTLFASTISAWGADYTLYRNFDEIAKQMGLGDNVSTSTSPIVLDNVVSMSMSAGYRWEKAQAAIRFYKSNGEIKFKARDGVTIKTIKVTWTAWADGGCLTTKTNGGTSITDPYIASSGSTITVNKNSISFWVGSTTTDDWRSIDITEVEIVYSDPTIFLEQYTAYPTTGGSSSITGDNGTYKWKINAQNRTQAVGSYSNCIKLQYGHSIASDGNLEGGIKSVSFDWRTTGGSYPNHFIVKAGSITDDIQIASFNNTKRILNYSKDFNIASNTTLSISNPAQENPPQNHIAVGPVHITPYLLFTAANHAVSIDCKTAETYDLKTVLINNTGATPIYTITSNGCGGSPTISSDGVIKLNTITKSGAIAVKASWEGVYTTLTLNVTAIPLPELKFAEANKTVCKNAAAFINPLQNKGNGTVSYESSNTSVAEVASNGTITIKGVGDPVTITATSIKTSAYFSGTASFTLTVSDNLTPSPLAPIDITETKEVKSITQDYGWTSEGNQPNIAYNGALALTSTNNPRTVTEFKYLRYYQTNNHGVLTMTANPTKAVIKSATMTYTPQNNGTLTKYWGTDGVNIPSDYRISTGSPYPVNAKTFSLYTGSSVASQTNGRADVGTFSIVYTDPTIVFERLQSYTSGTGNKNIDGDNQLYKWTVNAQNHSEAVGAYNGIKIQDGNSIAMNGDQEGGIKSVSFDYKVLSTSAIALNVSAGGTTHNFTHNAADASGRIFTYTHDFSATKNTALKIEMVSGKSPVAVGPMHITPYLLFNVANHAATLNAEDGTKCDLNSALINNTGATPTFTVEENNAGGNPTITDGILDFSSVVRTGTIKVQAAWGSVTTTLTLTINLKNPEISFGKTTDTKMITEKTYTQTLTSEKSSGAVTYSLVSAPDDKATIDPSSGEVTFSTAGEYKVQGKVAAALPYAEDSTTYTLTVTELIVPTLSFVAESIEKPVGAAGFINPFSKPDDDTGAVTYSSSETGVATVVADGDGTVTIVGAGTTTITASVAETSKYAADSKSYSLKVFPLPVMSMGNDTNVYLNAPNFIRTASVTAGDGEISYSSSDDSKATVNASTGEVDIKGSGSVVITATMAKGATYWSGSASYTIKVSDLKLPTASYSTTVVNKNQNDTAFTNNTLVTESDGVKTYESSDTRVAEVDATTGKVTMGEKPGTTTITAKIAANATWEKIEASYTLIVSSAPIADMHVVSKTVGDLKGSQSWANGSQHPNLSLDDAITLSDGNYYPTTQGGEFRYYFASSASYVAGQFTIQAKAGVIIQSVKFTYNKGNDNMVLSKKYTSGFVTDADQIISGNTYKVDANAVTFYAGKKAAATDNTHINVTGYEITYFDPSEGVAVTKTASDIAKDMGIGNEGCADELVINQAASIHIADPTYSGKTLRYYTSGPQFNMYVHTGGIDVKARKGAKIHYLKITYSRNYNAVLTKYFGTNGYNIPAVDCIASDSIIYVNADSIRLYAGTTNPAPVAQQYPSVAIKKIYVNYTDGEEVVVDNFDNCTAKSGDSVVVAGVDNKYTWTLKKFARDNAQRMYYDQSIKLSAGGAIYTPISGALKEVAFDWHPTEANKQVKFYVKAGSETITVDSTMNGTYTINFKKADIQDNDTFAISVDGQSATTLEIGHVSLTPYITYAQTKVEIDAKNYKDAGYKYTNQSLINNTGATVAYSISGSSDVAVIEDASSGAVTIKGAGTVTVIATADGKSARYSLTINLEETSAEFKNESVVLLLSAGSYKQKLNITTEATEGNVVNYSFVGEHDGATLSDSTVTFTKTGTFTIKGRLEQNMPNAAAEDYYTLTVNNAPLPGIYFPVDSIAKDRNGAAFSNPLAYDPSTDPAGVGAATYSSSNTDVATVVSDGTVTIVGSGKTTIKVVVAESASYAKDSASYILYVKPLPEMSFAEPSKSVYRNADPFINTLSISEGAGAVKYTSTDELVAMVDETSGEITIIGGGEVTITANSEESEQFSARSKSYTLTVINKILPALSFADAEVTKVHTDAPFTNELNQTKSPKSTGAVSYSSTDPLVATVATNGEVTLQGRIGTTIITGTIAAIGNFETASATFKLTVNEDPTPGGETVNGNIATIAFNGKWQTDQYRTYFKIDENISVSSAANNSQYQKSDESVRFYQKTNKGEFTIRAKAGVIIQAVKFTYTATNNGVITNNYGNDGKSIAAANQYASGTTYKFDANKLTFYTGSTSTADNADVHITSIVVKYFKPNMGVAVTKTMGDIGHQYKYKTDTCPQTVAVNNVISMKVNNSGTQKYLISKNICEFRYYQNSGPVTFQARKGAKIHYLKISYSSINNGVLNKFSANNNIPLTDQIASDSVIYVNDNSLTLYVGCTGTGSNTQARINKVYVVYTDSTASVDNFDQLTEIYGGATAKEVAGVDGVYSWKITQFNRDSLRRIGYDQSIMLRQNGGKIETVTDEGGVKEVSFDWFASDKTKGVKFAVNAGGQTITVDSAAANGYYPMTFTATEIKKNGAFSIEVDGTSGSQLEFGHISLTPYLLYKTKEATIDLGESYKNIDLINNTDGEGTITYSFDGTGDVAEDGTITPEAPGDYTVTATWGNVSTTYTLKVSGTLTLNEADDNAAKIAANEGKKLDVVIGRSFKAGMYNTICLPFGVSKTDLATAFGRTITSLAQYTQTASLDDAHKNLNVEIEDVEAIEAGNPYLLQFEGEDVTNPEFSQVTIVNTTGNTVGQGGTTQFIGTIGKKNIGANEKSVLFVIANNKLAWNNTGADSHMNGFRAYFNVPDMSDQSVAARLVFRQPATPTELMQNAQCTMQGVQKMIINNQLIIIREGKMYNAQGAEF